MVVLEARLLLPVPQRRRTRLGASSYTGGMHVPELIRHELVCTIGVWHTRMLLLCGVGSGDVGLLRAIHDLLVDFHVFRALLKDILLDFTVRFRDVLSCKDNMRL